MQLLPSPPPPPPLPHPPPHTELKHIAAACMMHHADARQQLLGRLTPPDVQWQRACPVILMPCWSVLAGFLTDKLCTGCLHACISKPILCNEESVLLLNLTVWQSTTCPCNSVVCGSAHAVHMPGHLHCLPKLPARNRSHLCAGTMFCFSPGVAPLPDHKLGWRKSDSWHLTSCMCVDRNEILLCDGEGCDVAVHQSCYAVARVPRGKWYCDACKDKLDLAKPNCVCCPVLGGVLRKVAKDSHADLILRLNLPSRAPLPLLLCACSDVLCKVLTLLY